mmetsp:Transcript_4331/g.16285  ORF Transcript_4331/g.16285 Transcript_4331/m.16285 type:complete len:238 (+) Transcript_4331:1561-2274(+)
MHTAPREKHRIIIPFPFATPVESVADVVCHSLQKASLRIWMGRFEVCTQPTVRNGKDPYDPLVSRATRLVATEHICVLYLPECVEVDDCRGRQLLAARQRPFLLQQPTARDESDVCILHVRTQEIVLDVHLLWAGNVILSVPLEHTCRSGGPWINLLQGFWIDLVHLWAGKVIVYDPLHHVCRSGGPYINLIHGVWIKLLCLWAGKVILSHPLHHACTSGGPWINLLNALWIELLQA